MAFTVMYDVMQWVDTNGDPASGFVLKAYDPGTTTPISIFIDKDGASPQATITFNAEGKPEVSGNEIVPFIDRDYKWAIFLNATDAAANTNPFAGFYDNIPQSVSSTDSSSASKTYLTLLLAVADAAVINIGDNIFLIERATDEGGGAHWEAVASTTNNGIDIVDTPLNTAISLKIIIGETLTPEELGADGVVATDTAVYARLAVLANAGTFSKLITDNLNTLSAGYIITADGFEHTGKGTIKTDPVIVSSPGLGINLAEYSGDNVRVIGPLFDGSSDNTALGVFTPTFNLVIMAGENCYWDARTKDSGGYALNVTGKNPTIHRHLDDNSQYSMVRFFPQEAWDYVRCGLVQGDRVSSEDGASGRGIIFNGLFDIDQIVIDQYRSVSRGILLDTGSPLLTHYKNVHIKSLVQHQVIDSGAASTEGTKLENVEHLRIDYCQITHDTVAISDFEPLKLTETFGSVNIGTLDVTGRIKLPSGTPVKIDLYKFKGQVVGDAIRAADSDNPVSWHFGMIWMDTDTVRASGVSVINHTSAGGRITIDDYHEEDEEFNLMKCSIRQPNLFVCYVPDFTEQVGSGFLESITRIPRQIISTLSNQLNTFNRGNIIWDETPSAGTTATKICITAGTGETLAGVTGAITTGTPDLVVNDASDLDRGDFITIVGVTGSFRITKIVTTAVTLDANADATVSGAAVAFSAAVFNDALDIMA